MSTERPRRCVMPHCPQLVLPAGMGLDLGLCFRCLAAYIAESEGDRNAIPADARSTDKRMVRDNRKVYELPG